MVKGYLIASNVPRNLPEWKKFIKDGKNDGTCFEFRGDGWNYNGKPELPFKEIVSATDLPLIVTIMPQYELSSSKFPFDEDERRDLLAEAIEVLSEKDGENYVTIELKSCRSPVHGRELVKKADEYGVLSIIADHDFEETPDRENILATLRKEKREGADVAKIGYMAQSKEDVLNTIHPLTDIKQRDRLGLPLIALSMGELGRISRLINVIFGFGSFGSVGEATGPGQYSIKEMKEILHI